MELAVLLNAEEATAAEATAAVLRESSAMIIIPHVPTMLAETAEEVAAGDMQGL